MAMEIHKSAEDYLEAMLMLKEERGYIKSVISLKSSMSQSLPSALQ